MSVHRVDDHLTRLRSGRPVVVTNAAAWGRIEVLSGSVPPDLTWVVTAGGRTGDFATMLAVSRGGVEVDEGGGRGKLRDGQAFAEYSVEYSDMPCFVMARTAPHIDRVVATTDQGTEVVLSLSPIFPEFGLRFAVAALPDGEKPGKLRAEVAGEVVQTFPDDFRRSTRQAESQTATTSWLLDRAAVNEDVVGLAVARLMQAGLIPPISVIQDEGQDDAPMVVIKVISAVDPDLLARIAEVMGSVPHIVKEMSATHGFLGFADPD
jgi:hypothetical protein